MAEGHYLVGQLLPYDAGKSTWAEWIEVVENFVDLNEITDEAQKRTLLITSCGMPTYQLMRNLVQPSKPKDKTFKELVEVVQNHRDPKPSVITERFRFTTRVRKGGESVQDYITELRPFSQHCDYGENLDTVLRDRLVCGVNDMSVQRKLLSESSDMTLFVVLKTAVATEAGMKNVTDIRREVKTAEDDRHRFYVNQAVRRQASSGKVVQGTKLFCWRCRGNHGAGVCPYRKETCYKCKKTDLVSKRCDAIRKWRMEQSSGEKEGKQSYTH